MAASDGWIVDRELPSHGTVILLPAAVELGVVASMNAPSSDVFRVKTENGIFYLILLAATALFAHVFQGGTAIGNCYT